MRPIVIAAFVVALFTSGPVSAVPAGLVEVSNSFTLTQGTEKDTKKKKSTEKSDPSTSGKKDSY